MCPGFVVQLRDATLADGMGSLASTQHGDYSSRCKVKCFPKVVQIVRSFYVSRLCNAKFDNLLIERKGQFLKARRIGL